MSKRYRKKITDKQADYVLALKKNQNSLYEDIELYFRGFNDRNGDIDVYESVEKNGGRIETRKCYKTNKIDWLEHNGWSNLNRIVMVKSTREINGEVSSETRFFISSLKDGFAKNMLGYIRNHWQVENNLHWQLDVAFNEDKWLSKVGNAAKNRAIMNKIALNMLMHEKTAKVGVKNKRLKAAWDINYHAKVINAAV